MGGSVNAAQQVPISLSSVHFVISTKHLSCATHTANTTPYLSYIGIPYIISSDSDHLLVTSDHISFEFQRLSCIKLVQAPARCRDALVLLQEQLFFLANLVKLKV